MCCKRVAVLWCGFGGWRWCRARRVQGVTEVGKFRKEMQSIPNPPIRRPSLSTSVLSPPSKLPPTLQAPPSSLSPVLVIDHDPTSSLLSMGEALLPMFSSPIDFLVHWNRPPIHCAPSFGPRRGITFANPSLPPTEQRDPVHSVQMCTP